MTSMLQHLVREAVATADPAETWVSDGGRGCPIGHDNCSQPVFRLAGTDHYDYGDDPRGPGITHCRTACPNRREPAEHLFDDDMQQYADVREEREEAEQFLRVIDAPKPAWARHCQEGGELCRAGQRDGVICADDDCDIDAGVRPADS